MDKNSIIKILEEISIMLELKGENPFKIRAYQNAARALEVSGLDIDKNTSLNELLQIKGVGQNLAGYIITLASGKRLDFYEELKEAITPEILEMLKIPTLGPKKVKFLTEELDIENIADLEKAISENRLAGLPNFGAKTQENIARGIGSYKKFREFYLYADVINEAELIINKIMLHQDVANADIAGSIRRKKETVKDIDMVASVKTPSGAGKVMDYFTGLCEVGEIMEKGETKSSVRLTSGINVDLRIVEEDRYPYLLHHFTGSREHNTALRGIARDMGIKVNEYGIFKEDELISCASEEEIYRVFKMDFIPPELRENNGELEAALNGSLPDLAKEKDLRGFFHIHTTFSDGNITLNELCRKLESGGFEYAGISDHSRSAFYAGGIRPEDIGSYLDAIDRVSMLNPKIRLFKGIESDILPDGSLDYDDAVLEKFDFVIASVHSNFGMNEDEMTGRIIKAIENRYTTMLAHPTGRLLLSREPYKVDMIKVINAASENNVAIEINSSPFRMDLDWRLCKYAKEKKVKIFINPDAHNLEDLDNYLYGINVARKGWLEKDDIINTLGKSGVENYLKNSAVLKNRGKNK